jgi:hypothetical protein
LIIRFFLGDPLTSMGRLICDDIGWGWTYDQIAQHIHAALDPRNVTLSEVGSIVRTAHATYCPRQQCWTAHC